MTMPLKGEAIETEFQNMKKRQAELKIRVKIKALTAIKITSDN